MGQFSYLYNNRRWRMRRAAQLKAQPLCQLCLTKTRITQATVADHIEPHRGDALAFYSSPLQSLCKSCHDSLKQQAEQVGFTNDIGLDGFPIDRRHPFNR